MYYPQELVDEIREKTNIVDVIGQHVKLQKRGTNHFGLCPFHNEKSPSFSVSETKQIFYCFGCGKGGNVYTFLQEYENASFPEAVKMLAERAGVSLPEAQQDDNQRARENRRQKLLEVNKEAAKFFYYQLRSRRGEIGMQYFQGRELTEETMQHFGLGYSGKGSGELIQYLKNKGYEDDLLIEAGLATFDEQRGLSGKFWNRVMFPIQDANHRVIGFGGRVLGDGKPKYVNTSDTPVFDKSRNLYGLNFARTSRKNHFILCEGYMDVISMHQAGFTEAVASLGTAFTSGQAVLLRRFAQEVLLAYDSDTAGVNAALRAIGICREAGMRAKVLSFAPHKDPDEFIKAEGAEAFQKRIEEAENSFYFEVRIMERSHNLSDPDGLTAFHRAIAKKLCAFPEEVERENYLQGICRKYRISVDSMRKLVVSYAVTDGEIKPVERARSTQSAAQKAVKNSPERLLLTWLTDKPSLFSQIKPYIGIDDFVDPVCHKVAETIFPDLEKGMVRPDAVIGLFEDPEEQSQASAIFSTYLEEVEEETDREKAFADIVFGVKKNAVNFYSKDPGAIMKVFEGRQILEKLSRVRFNDV